MPDTLVPPEVFTYPEIKEAIMQLHNGGDAPYIIEALYNPLSEDEMTENYDVRRIDVLATLNIMKIDDDRTGNPLSLFLSKIIFKRSGRLVDL